MRWMFIFLIISLSACEKSENGAVSSNLSFINTGHLKIPIDLDGTSIKRFYSADSATPIDGSKLVVEQFQCGGIKFVITFMAMGYPMYEDLASVEVISSSTLRVGSFTYYAIPDTTKFKEYEGPLHKMTIEASDMACATEWFVSAQYN